jgi:hypothetical protein
MPDIPLLKQGVMVDPGRSTLIKELGRGGMLISSEAYQQVFSCVEVKKLTIRPKEGELPTYRFKGLSRKHSVPVGRALPRRPRIYWARCGWLGMVLDHLIGTHRTRWQPGCQPRNIQGGAAAPPYHYCMVPAYSVR